MKLLKRSKGRHSTVSDSAIGSIISRVRDEFLRKTKCFENQGPYKNLTDFLEGGRRSFKEVVKNVNRSKKKPGLLPV